MGVVKNVDIDKAQELYASGLTLAQVGKSLGVSTTTIRARFQVAGIPRRNTRSKQAKAPTQTQPTRICSCCQRKAVPTRPVNGVKLTRLCERCYHQGVPEDDPHAHFLSMALVNY